VFAQNFGLLGKVIRVGENFSIHVDPVSDAWDDWNTVPAVSLQHLQRQPCPHLDVLENSRHPHQVNLRAAQQHPKRQGIVNIVSNICIQNDLLCGHTCFLKGSPVLPRRTSSSQKPPANFEAKSIGKLKAATSAKILRREKECNRQTQNISRGAP